MVPLFCVSCFVFRVFCFVFFVSCFVFRVLCFVFCVSFHTVNKGSSMPKIVMYFSLV